MGTKERRPAEKWLDFNNVTQRENWVRDLEVCGEGWLCLEIHGSADYPWEEEDHFEAVRGDSKFRIVRERGQSNHGSECLLGAPDVTTVLPC